MAGIHRLLECADDIRQAPVIVVVAGITLVAADRPRQAQEDGGKRSLGDATGQA